MQKSDGELRSVVAGIAVLVIVLFVMVALVSL
jgi:hypothetical protein